MYVSTRLGRLYYEEHGRAQAASDPAIVLLHGLLFDGGMWKAFLPSLGELARVVVFDGPGHGKSECPPPFTLEEHAEAFDEALRALGITKAVIVGLSWGGMLAMRVALRHLGDDVVTALALLDTSAHAESVTRRIRYRTFTALHRRVGVPPWLYRQDIAPKMFAPRTLREQPDLVEDTYTRMQGFSREGIARAAEAVVVKRKSIASRIGALRVPTLVLCGREDRATDPARSVAIANSIPNARLVFLDDVGHMSPLEAPDRVAAELVPFVRSVMPAR